MKIYISIQEEGLLTILGQYEFVDQSIASVSVRQNQQQGASRHRLGYSGHFAVFPPNSLYDEGNERK